MNNLPAEMNNQLFRKLKSAIELQRMSAKERLAYEYSIASERDFSACISASYEDGIAEGKAKGIEEGLDKGITKGKAEGEAKGKAEGEAVGFLAAMRQTALNMKKRGMDLASITDCTGLSADTILAL